MAFDWRRWFKSDSKAASEARSLSLKSPEEWLRRALSGDFESVSGVSVTPLKALGVATVYSIVRTTARTLSTLPLSLIQTAPDGTKTAARGHRLYDLLTCAPNEFMTATDFLGAMEGNRVLRGNAFAQVVRSARGVEELIPLAASQVRWRMTGAGPEIYIDNELTAPEDVLHLKDFTESGLYGTATTSHVRDVVGLAIALQDNASTYFANGSKVSDVLRTDSKLTPDQVNALADRLRDRQDHQTLVLDNGLDYKVTRGSNRDSQMIEARRLQREEIAAAFGIPASKAGILDHATFSNIEQLGIDFVVSYLQPICVQWEQAMNHRLLTAAERADGLAFKFKLQGLMRGDAAARSAFYRNGILDGWLTRNEVRKLEDYNAIDGLDEPLVPLNMLILDAQGNPTNPDPRANQARGFYARDSKENNYGQRLTFKS